MLMIAPTSFFADYGCHVRILAQARGLIIRGHQVLVCTYGTGRDLPDIPIRRTPRLPWRHGLEVGSSWHKLLLDQMLFFLSLRAARSWKPDLVHAFLHEGALIGSLICRLLRLPLVFDFQGSLTSEMLDHRFLTTRSPFIAPLRRLEHWIDRQPAMVLANSHHSAGLLVNSYGVSADKIRVLPDCVDVQRFAPSPAQSKAARDQRRHELGIPADAVVVIYLGLLAPYQGTDHLLRAFSKLGKTPHTHLLVMGFPDVDHYRALAASLGLAGRVTFTGAVTYEMAHEMLALGDIAAGPKISETEGSGKLLDYMAMGLATIAFDTPVSREYLGDAGVFVTVGDEDQLAEAICRLAKNAGERERRGALLRRRAVELYSWPHRLDIAETAYGDLMAVWDSTNRRLPSRQQ